MVNTILAKRVNHIVAKGDNPAWPKGSKSRGFSKGERKGNDTILFGIVVGLAEDEYGYISLNELSEVEFDLTAQGLGKLQVRQQENFPPMPLKNLQDFRLQRFLARFED